MSKTDFNQNEKICQVTGGMCKNIDSKKFDENIMRTLTMCSVLSGKVGSQIGYIGTHYGVSCRSPKKNFSSGCRQNVFEE